MEILAASGVEEGVADGLGADLGSEAIDGAIEGPWADGALDAAHGAVDPCGRVGEHGRDDAFVPGEPEERSEHAVDDGDAHVFRGGGDAEADVVVDDELGSERGGGVAEGVGLLAECAEDEGVEDVADAGAGRDEIGMGYHPQIFVAGADGPEAEACGGDSILEVGIGHDDDVMSTLLEGERDGDIRVDVAGGAEGGEQEHGGKRKRSRG